MRIKKAIIPLAGLGTRFLPLSKVLNKEFWPLADLPIIEYIVREAVDSGIKEIIFVNKPGDKKISSYFEKNSLLEKKLKKRKRNECLKSLEELEKISKKISFSFAYQEKPLGDGHAVLQAQSFVKKQACLILFGDDVVDSEVPCSLQLIKVFNKYKKPVIALHELEKEKLGSYGIARVEKINSRVYKIKEIIEKPLPGKAPSNLAVVGKYIIDSDVFDFLKNSPCKAKGEIRLAGAFNEMIKKGMTVLGYKFKGKWLECGSKTNYLKSNFYFSLKHPCFGKELKKFLNSRGGEIG